MVWLFHLMTFDPILESTDEQLVVKNIILMFFRLISTRAQQLAGNEISLHIKKI